MLKDLHRSPLLRSRITAADRLQVIEAEIARLLQSFPDLPARPRSRTYGARRRSSPVPIIRSPGAQKLH